MFVDALFASRSIIVFIYIEKMNVSSLILKFKFLLSFKGIGEL